MPPPLMSPSTFLPHSENMPFLVGQPRLNGQLPLQQSISSASPMPFSPSKQSFSSHVASIQYVEQHRTFVDHQRKLHDEERGLWQLERQELHTKITELEATVRQLEAKATSAAVSPMNLPPFVRTTFGSTSTDRGSRTSMSGGDEFWRGAGGKSDAQPTRTFSDSSDYSSRGDDKRMPSIAEDGPTTTGGSVAERKDSQHQPSIDGAQIDRNLDGISFKINGLPPSVVERVMGPQSPSPKHSPHSPSPKHTTPLKHLDLPVPSSEDAYTRNAGHTPLARMDSLGDLSNAASSNQATPRLPDPEISKEPSASMAVSRPPNERSDSYFPNPPDPFDEDPALKGPLGLKNEPPEDKSFLKELDSKLLQAARTSTYSPSELSDEERADKGHTSDGDGEPTLRIKRSMNFGSVFGAANCGKGI